MRRSSIHALDPLNILVASTLKLGMTSGTFLRIEYVYGFELFGAYETFSGGWRITDPQVRDHRLGRDGKLPLMVEGTTIESAIQQWANAREQSIAAGAEVTP